MAEIDFGKRIAELRVAKKMTQAQLGGLLFVSSQWKNGSVKTVLNPKTKTLYLIMVIYTCW